MAVISEGHKEVVNIRTAGAASKCSAGNTFRILIRPNSLKPLFGALLLISESDALEATVLVIPFYITITYKSIYVLPVRMLRPVLSKISGRQSKWHGDTEM